jgi:Flp pilus assembly protein TadD
MKVFLSHSSKDKPFVEAVADQLRPGTFEMDSQTFDEGLLNSNAIIASLNRSDLFCLFLSKFSVTSSYVDFESLLGFELLASGRLSKFLVICLDDEAFQQAAMNVRYFNIVRKSLVAESAARLIQGNLVSIASKRKLFLHPFIGREAELLELERQVTDHDRPLTKALFLSGNSGSGRRSIARKFFKDQFPSVGQIFPTIDIDDFAGLDELYRKVLGALRPTMVAGELKVRVQGFNFASVDEKRRQIAELFNSLLPARESAFVMDMGGVLADTGALNEEINEIVNRLESKPHPPIVFVAPRMTPMKYRRAEEDIAYLAVKSLNYESTERLVSKLLKDREIQANQDDLEKLVILCDGHPYNVYRMVDEVAEKGLASFLANPRDFVEWKHRQSSEYVSRVNLTGSDFAILYVLNVVPELDFASIVDSLRISPDVVSESLLRLTNLHVIESTSERFLISPSLRIAVERDKRIRLPEEKRKGVLQFLANSLTVRLEEGTASIALIDAAVLSSLESNSGLSAFVSAFLLPSHNIILAKRHYDQRHWKESLRYAAEALKGGSRLSSNALVAACRYLCLASARLGESDIFLEGIGKLEAKAKDSWTRSNIAFLRGFDARLKGNLPDAESYFRKSFDLSPGNLSAAREIAAICLARDNHDDAEHFAREAYSHARSNPYLLDILIAVLVRKHGRDANFRNEIDGLFEVLEQVGEEAGRSFYSTRKAEYEHLWGSNKEALRLIEEAIKRTPTLFEPRRIYAEILLKEGNKQKALEQIDYMKGIVNARDPSERRSNYRSYLNTYAHYLTEVGKYTEAKQIYDDISIFTLAERNASIREIEIVEGFKKNKR